MIIEAGQVAVVTGAARGLGRALATRLIDRGLSVVLADVAQETLHDTAEEFTARGAPVLPVVTDVSDSVAVSTLTARTLEHFGRVDLVVNNAGIASGAGAQPLWQTSSQAWQRVLAVNLLGVVHGIRAFVPHLVAAGAGHVVNIASLAGLSTWPFGAAYCASKHAVVAVSETLHCELDVMGLPIGVTVACPGLIRTSLYEQVNALAQADDDGRAELAPAQVTSAERTGALLQRLLSTIIEPDVAAERILTAVQANRLYALTHGDPDGDARDRVEGILAAVADTAPARGGWTDRSRQSGSGHRPW